MNDVEEKICLRQQALIMHSEEQRAGATSDVWLLEDGSGAFELEDGNGMWELE